MADIQNPKYGDLFTNLYPYQKNFYNISTIPSTETYRGTVEIPAGLTQKGTGTYPLVHAKDVQIGNKESDRLNDKLADYDIILRELYGRAPSQLEQLSDGRSSQEIKNLNTEEGRSNDNDNLRVANNDGLESLDKIATVLNNRTETVDDRLLDLRAFKTVNINVPVNNTNDLTNGNSQTEIKADNNADSISIRSENEWIILTPDASSDSFTIGHYKKGFSKTTGTAINLNSDNTNTITLQTVEYDAAGHITTDTNTTYTLPQNFKTVSVLNANATNNTNPITVDDGSINANNSFAMMQFVAGNKWIQFATDSQNRKIYFAHSLSGITAGDIGDENNATLNFGSGFNIPELKVDAAGHITGSSSHTITLPSLSLQQPAQNSGNVIVDITMSDVTNGAIGKTITKTSAYIGSLTLNGYELGSDNTAVEATDSLNAAISKLQRQISTEITAINDAINTRAFIKGQNDSIVANNGTDIEASGQYSYAEGDSTKAQAYAAHAEGVESIAAGLGSHSEGDHTIAWHKSTHVFGEYNVEDKVTEEEVVLQEQRGNYVEIVGNGDSTTRSNARTLDWSGNETLAGSLTLGAGTVNEVTITAEQLNQLLQLLNGNEG